MKSCHYLALLVAVAYVDPIELRACDPGEFSMKHGGFGGKGAGVFIPGPVAQMPAAPNPAAYATIAQHRQALAAQAAAYRAARQPLKLAKAYALRQATLAARESRRAWVLARQQEHKRAARSPDLQTAPERAGSVYVATRVNAPRSLDP
ncbi:MAG: hypothetical protein H6823_01390 [Planctomycetaceae bacterium]|nr:hypothetical protein [Planctomycetales bacterium]MCB9936871.1 hypothetical protein [Planctomycetaceae bacterium]